MTPEFRLIARYFTHRARRAVLGVGDDAALLRPRAGTDLVVSADMLVAGTHFFPDTDPRLIGHKAIAVNLSDMAAMGATPRWALLAIALPAIDGRWIAQFARGFMATARRYAVDLVGGDTTRGPLNLSVTILGEVARGKALRRDQARAGDDVWISGCVGDAALAVAHRQGRIRLAAAQLRPCARALDEPQPQVLLGHALRGVAHGAIDVSDGLVADLGHICERSRLAADVRLVDVPCSDVLRARLRSRIGMEALLSGGDDYQLCFTASPSARPRILRIGARLGIRLTRIGAMRRGRGVHVLDERGRKVCLTRGGFDHFR